MSLKDLKISLVLQAADKISKPFKTAMGASKNLQSAVKDTSGRLRGLEAASRDLASFSRLKEQADSNSEALKKAQLRAQKLGREMATADKVTKRMTTSFEAARKSVTRLKAKEDSLRQSISEVRTKLQKQDIATTNVDVAQRKLNHRIKRATQDMDGYANKLEKARIRTNKLTKARNAFNRSMAQKANAGIVGAAGVATGGTMLRGAASIVQPGIAFEEQMSKVGALARIDKTSAQFAELNTLAKTLGETTHFSATQAAEGMGFLAMAGFETNQIIATMPGLLNLAKAGGMELGRTADIASNILSGFGLEASEMGRVSDVLAATFTRTNVDLGMLGDTMKYVAPIARTLGVSVEEASAMAGLLGNVGIQGQQAGTALRAIQSRLAAPPAMARKAIDQLGLSITDASGNMLPMVDIMGEVAKKTEKMGSAVRLGFFKHIAGEEAGSAFAELVNQGGSKAITQFTTVLQESGNEAERIAKQMGDNSAGDIKAFGSAWEAVNITLTETNTSPMRELIQLGTGILRSTNEWIKENPKLAGTLFKVFAVAAVGVTILGGLALAAAGILGPIAAIKLGFLSVAAASSWAFPIVATGIKMITGVLMANPIGLAIAGIAMAAWLIYDNWEPISNWFSNMWSLITLDFEDGTKLIKSLLTDLGKFALWIADKVMAPFALAKTIGTKIGSWLGGGDDNEASELTKSSSPLTKTVATAAIATTAVATPVAASPAAQVQNNQRYEIVINPAPGADANEIAQAVREEMQRIEEENAARARSKLYD
jgi:TP901 family phage tail tape measure protein